MQMTPLTASPEASLDPARLNRQPSSLASIPVAPLDLRPETTSGGAHLLQPSPDGQSEPEKPGRRGDDQSDSPAEQDAGQREDGHRAGEREEEVAAGWNHLEPTARDGSARPPAGACADGEERLARTVILLPRRRITQDQRLVGGAGSSAASSGRTSTTNSKRSAAAVGCVWFLPDTAAAFFCAARQTTSALVARETTRQPRSSHGGRRQRCPGCGVSRNPSSPPSRIPYPMICPRSLIPVADSSVQPESAGMRSLRLIICVPADRNA